MNNAITVYELLGLIKDGKINGNTYIKYFDRNFENTETSYVSLNCIIDLLFSSKVTLNDQVEILQEDKPIIEKTSDFIGATDNEFMFNIREIKDKLNEVIDYLNRKEDK